MNESDWLAQMSNSIKSDPVLAQEALKLVEMTERHGMTLLIKRGEGMGVVTKSGDGLDILPMDKMEEEQG